MADEKVRIQVDAEDNASDSFKGVGLALGALAAAAVAAAAALAGIAVAFGKAIETAKEQQKADVALAAALRTTGQNTREVRDDITALANELQDLTITDDRVVKSVAALLASLGQLTGDKLKRATRATLDFAAALGMDATSAALLMAKAADGMPSVLSRYGVKIDESIPKSEQFNAILEVMERKFGGIAEAMGQTFAGNIDRVKNDLNDAAELIGDVVVKSGAFNQILKDLSDTAKEFQQNLKDSPALLREFEIAIANAALVAGRSLITIGQLGLKIARIFEFLGRIEWADVIPIGLKPETDATKAYAAAIDALAETLTNLETRFRNTQSQMNRMAELEATIQREGMSSPEGIRALRELMRLRVELGGSVMSVEDRLGNVSTEGLKAAAADVTYTIGQLQGPLDELDQARQAIGLQTMMALEQQAALIKTAFDLAVASFEQQGPEGEEAFDRTVEQIKKAGDAIVSAGGAVDYYLTSIGRVPEESWYAFAEAEQAASTFGQVLQTNVVNIGLQGVGQLATFLVDAFTGGTRSFKEFAVQFLKQIAAMIIEALILKAIMSSFSFGIGGFAGGGGLSMLGGLGSLFADAALSPSFSPGGAGQAGVTSTPLAPLSVSVLPAPSREAQAAEMIEDMIELVERKGYRLVASEVLGRG